MQQKKERYNGFRGEDQTISKQNRLGPTTCDCVALFLLEIKLRYLSPNEIKWEEHSSKAYDCTKSEVF